ncbi:hypothetical protein M758_8G129000 [Ceratodon purpureus]|uniref:Glutamate--cysteine ligase n=1 Tax=Ceratodon purpureus TaxID=3225 RepID=A0A8T0H1Q6_CERPU|nr:hypothetical protein KC19_8G133600 [Ceratodon purpureus]KAG0608745.1 hypothetical protein M758_8G129000 [Ceratodon purpureus]
MAGMNGATMAENAPVRTASNGEYDRFGTKVQQANGSNRTWPIKPAFRSNSMKSTEKPLTKEDLVAYLVSGCKPKANWRVGVENEKFGFQLDTLKPMTLDNIHELLEGMASHFGHKRIIEDGTIAGLQKDGQSVTLEPGGQFELSGAPLEDIHAVKRELDIHLEEVNTIGKELGLGFAGMGYEPKWPIPERPYYNKAGRFDIVHDYVRDIGAPESLKVMHQTCTGQVNLDFDSEQDMINKLRVGLSFQPIATALFATSPFSEGKPTGYLSYRSITWTEFDDKRTGVLPFVFDDDFGFEKYAEYALNVPMLMIYRNQHWHYTKGASFKDFMAGKLQGFEGERPSIEDWMNHLGNLYPEVRLKKYLEMRGADCGPRPFLLALPAFWVGLLYDEQSLQGALEIIRDWTNDEREMLRNEAPRLGLQVPFRGGLLKDVAQDIVKLAKEGLIRRGLNEEGYLAPIEEVASSGVTLAERLLKLYYDKWDKKVDPIFDELRL